MTYSKHDICPSVCNVGGLYNKTYSATKTGNQHMTTDRCLVYLHAEAYWDSSMQIVLRKTQWGVEKREGLHLAASSGSHVMLSQHLPSLL